MGGWNRSRGDGLAAAASRAVEAWLIGSYMEQAMLELEYALRREREQGAERTRRHRAKPEVLSEREERLNRIATPYPGAIAEARLAGTKETNDVRTQGDDGDRLR